MSNHHDPAVPADPGAGHDAGHDVPAESSPVDTARPVPYGALVWPLVVFLLVVILAWGPVSEALGAPGSPPVQPPLPTPTAAPTTAPATAVPPAATAVPATDTAVPPTETAVPPTDTAVPPTDTAVPPTDTALPEATATQAAALPPAYGDTQQGVPQAVALDGTTFRVAVSGTTVPDWVFSPNPTVANWIRGTVVNYVLGISYSADNAHLFAGARPGDTVQLTRADGAIYNFAVDSVRRVDPSDVSLLAQDHPALTLLLLGDPAADRAVIQGHFSEASAP